MNIVELLKSKESSVTLLYYGKDDMASGFQVKTLVDNGDDIYNYFNNKKTRVNSLDNYIDYIFLDTFSKLNEIVPMVREELKNKVSMIIDVLIEEKKKYKKSDLNRFIKTNYNIVL